MGKQKNLQNQNSLGVSTLQQKEKAQVQLQKTQSSYKPKLIIPENVETQFRTLCALSPSLEWSGVLFYTITGNFENENLEITCKDFFLMDQGNTTATTVDFSTPEIAGYMAQHMELLDCYHGLAHSHHRMEAFFSGVDQQTLLQEGSSMNNFVSLIVNNAGKYVAAITRKLILHETKNIKVDYDGTIPFFNLGKSTFKPCSQETHEENDIVAVEWYDLEIIKNPVADNPVITRFKSITEDKKEKTSSRLAPYFKSWAENEEPNLFSSTPYSGISYGGGWNEDVIPHGTINQDLQEDLPELEWDENNINRFLKQLLYGTPFVNKEHFDIDKFLKSIHKYYNTRFNADNEDEMQSFIDWIDSWVDWLFYDYDWTWAQKELGHRFDADQAAACLAIKCLEILDKYRNDRYVGIICDKLENYSEL